MRIIFMGSPEFALPSLNALHANYDICAVVTQPDRRAGRGQSVHESAVKRQASLYDLPTIQPESLRSEEVYRELAALRADLIVVSAFGQILPIDILELPKYGSINVHASLLPRWRGAAPVQAAILAGDNISGVTIMKMDAGLDTGPILNHASTPIGENETGGELGRRLSDMGGQLLIKTIPRYVSGEIKPRPQDESKSTYAPMLKKRDGEIDPSHDAVHLARQVRAFEPWPSSFFFWDQLRIVVRAAFAHPSHDSAVGRVINLDGQPAISTPNGSLVLERIQPAGKREMSASEFLNGAPGFIGTRIKVDLD